MKGGLQRGASRSGRAPMIEYALLLGNIAGSMLQTLQMKVQSWASVLHWSAVVYAVMALLAFKVLRWAFRPRDQ
jgi:Flp pilus assembly pilin Flp